MTAPNSDHLLASIRQDIDEIDDQLVELVLRRLSTSARVREAKGGAGGMTMTPYRPAREAQIMRRLAGQAGSNMAGADLVRLWRVILSASINAQATVTLHVDDATGLDIDCRLMIAEHFCGMPVAVHPDIGSVVRGVCANPVDLAVLNLKSSWVDAFAGGAGSALFVLSGLPSLTATSQAPRLLIAGSCAVQPSGDDLTLLTGLGALPPGFHLPTAWEATSGRWTVTGVSGFLREDDPAFAAFTAGHPGLQLRIAGSIPNPAKAMS